MKVLFSVLKAFFILLIVVAVSGCMGKSPTETSALSAPIKSSLKTPKPGAAIKLVSASLIDISPNQPTQTTVVLDIMAPNGELNIELSSSPGLSLGDAELTQVIKHSPPAPVEIPILLSAANNGRYYLNMHISVVGNDNTRSVRNLAVIVQVGPVVNSAVRLQKTPGENVIVLPAQETVVRP